MCKIGVMLSCSLADILSFSAGRFCDHRKRGIRNIDVKSSQSLWWDMHIHVYVLIYIFAHMHRQHIEQILYLCWCLSMCLHRSIAVKWGDWPAIKLYQIRTINVAYLRGIQTEYPHCHTHTHTRIFPYLYRPPYVYLRHVQISNVGLLTNDRRTMCAINCVKR